MMGLIRDQEAIRVNHLSSFKGSLGNAPRRLTPKGGDSLGAEAG